MSEIQEFAKEIATDISKPDDKNYSFDMALIIIIGSIIINVLQLLMKCNVFGRKLDDRVKNPGPIDTILLNRSIKKELPTEYAHLREQVKQSILTKVQSLPSDKIYGMAKEAENAK
jgi:hypothetical protein